MTLWVHLVQLYISATEPSDLRPVRSFINVWLYKKTLSESYDFMFHLNGDLRSVSHIFWCNSSGLHVNSSGLICEQSNVTLESRTVATKRFTQEIRASWRQKEMFLAGNDSSRTSPDSIRCTAAVFHPPLKVTHIQSEEPSKHNVHFHSVWSRFTAEDFRENCLKVKLCGCGFL